MSAHPLWPTADEPTITEFPVRSARPSPAVVVLPGGGYGRLADHEGAAVAEWLNTLGIAAFVAHYRVAPHRHPLPLLDAARAMRWVRHHAPRLGVDPARVGVLGFSAGGHLAGLLSTESGSMLPEGPHDAIDAEDARPGLAVLCYPVVSLAGSAAHQGSAANLLGEDAREPALTALSIEQRVTSSTPSMFLWHTADDPVVPLDNTLHLASALARHQVPVEVHVYPHGPHGLGLAESEPVVGDWTRRCATFLDSHWGDVRR